MSLPITGSSCISAKSLGWVEGQKHSPRITFSFNLLFFFNLLTDLQKRFWSATFLLDARFLSKIYLKVGPLWQQTLIFLADFFWEAVFPPKTYFSVSWALKYQEIMHLSTFAKKLQLGCKHIFHWCLNLQKWFSAHSIIFMIKPSLSPDLNHIETL